MLPHHQPSSSCDLPSTYALTFVNFASSLIVQILRRIFGFTVKSHDNAFAHITMHVLLKVDLDE